MSTSNQILLEKYIEAYNQGALDQLDELVSENYIHHNNGNNLTLAQFKRGATWLRNGMPDFHISVADMVSADDKVAVRFIGYGTHASSLVGETPTQKTITIHGITIYRIENGRIAEDWEAMDEHDFMNQIGALPK